MICTFFGHRDTPTSIRCEIKKAILKLIKNGISEFYVGNNGSFDFLTQSVLIELLNEGNKINCFIVLSRLNELALCGQQDFTVFPEEIEGVMKKFAISKRNEYLIKKSNMVICYVNNTFSNCHKWIEKARKKWRTIINLAKN